MGTIVYHPSVRVYRMPDDPDQVCFASYHARRGYDRPVVNKIKLYGGPLHDSERKRWRILRKEIIDELEHLPNGGGVLVHIKVRAKWFSRGQIYGIGKTMDLATANGYREQGWARGQTYYDGGRVEDHGRMAIADNSKFYWIEKAGETREFERKVKAFSGKLWFRSAESEGPNYGHQGVGMGLRG